MDENTVRFRENDDRYYTKVHIVLQFKSGKMERLRCRIKFFSDEIFMGKYFEKKKEMFSVICYHQIDRF